ncbi:MAG: FAD-dependent thymidylate synthase [Dehalococcoidia bacterium]|nr:FAD-dependent thymidylate synthase [Dehalococcoidia bacterium]
MNIIKPSHEIIDGLDAPAIMRKLEACGRIAYKSEDKIAPGTAEKFLAGILKRGHESVIEHVTLSVKFICDRGVTHELVRHRLCAFTQESTRYCNYGKLGMTFIKPCFWQPGTTEYLLWLKSMEEAEFKYLQLLEIKATPQEARSVLPNSLKTEIICTANLREWRHILKLRTSKAAHPQMREVMLPLLAEFRKALPVIFGDIEVELPA